MKNKQKHAEFRITVKILSAALMTYSKILVLSHIWQKKQV